MARHTTAKIQKGQPPVKKARTEVQPGKSALKGKAKAPAGAQESEGKSVKPKFSLRVKGSPRPGNGKGKSRDTANLDARRRERQKEEEGDEEEGDEEEDDESKEDIAQPPQPKSKQKQKASATKVPKPRTLPTSFKIVAGSYEKLLYGLEGTISHSSTSLSTTPKYTFSISPIFIFPAHVSCIKAVAASPEGGKWLATGSADEIVKVWDLRRRKEIGGLMHHEGSITHLVFPSRSHLLSASEDGTLCLFRARDWSVLRALRGHKGRVNAVAVHPSGKVALSVGRDKTLRMWDLMRGKGSASTKLGKEGEIVRWSTDGSLFAVQSGSTIDIYTTNMDLIHTIKHASRLHDVRFCKRVEGEGELLLAAAEDKLLSVYDISPDPAQTPKIITVMTGHGNRHVLQFPPNGVASLILVCLRCRVKAVQTLDIALPPAPASPTETPSRGSTTIACTVSSDGMVHVYDLALVPASASVSGEKAEIAPVAVYDTKGTRLTCLTLADGEAEVGPRVGEKRKKGEESESEEEGNEEWPSGDEEEEEEEEEEIESD
ncbi:hypothetical protein DXG01_015030 [Tephrocybe rancida]|nr:hypothetical protein DXG01_015030 [Tephrocybe rancida]